MMVLPKGMGAIVEMQNDEPAPDPFAQLPDTLADVHRQNFPAIDPEWFRELVAEYWNKTTPDCRSFYEILERVRFKQLGSVAILGNGSNIASILCELGELGWEVDDEGETCVVDFAVSKLRVFIDRTASPTRATIQVYQGKY